MDAYVVVYSILDRATFERALEILYELRRDPDKHPAIILVANKSDVVRSRQVSEEGKPLLFSLTLFQFECLYK